MVTRLKQKKTHSITIEFSNESVTSFGGLSLAERLASRLGLWRKAETALPERAGYEWLEIIKPAVMGLLSGSRGTYAAEELREDSTLLSLLGLDAAPEEATVWRSLKGLGALVESGVLGAVQSDWVRQVLGHVRLSDVLCHGFFPVFGDGSLLEGSTRREGTKWIKEKGEGLLWCTVFAGPLLAAQRLARAGEGEETCVREMLGDVMEKVLRPLRLDKRALFLLDSLHGDGVTLSRIDEWEHRGAHYIVGANKLAKTQTTLSDLSEYGWVETGPNKAMGWSASSVCVCWLQCDEWEKKRTLVGRRYMPEGEFVWHYSGVLTNLEKNDVRHLMVEGANYANAIWCLYDMKAGMENYYKDGLDDLGLHHPPCREHTRNAGFYAVATLAHTLATAVDLIGGKSSERGSNRRQDGGERRRARPRRMRLWRLRRRLFSLPARVSHHARVLRVTLLGVGAGVGEEFERYFLNVCRC
jgi:hypothetical protein